MFVSFVSVINLHFLGGKSKMGFKIRNIISHKAMWFFGIRPCDFERAFPGQSSGNASETQGTFFKVNDIGKTPNSNKEQDCRKNRHWSTLSNQGKQNTASIGNNDTAKIESNLTEVVKNAVFLESEENMDFLWKYFAVFVDRVFFALNLLVTLVIIIGFLVG